MRGYRSLLSSVINPDIPTVDELMFGDADHGDHSLNKLDPISLSLKPAAVLMPIVERPSGPHMILTVRATHLPKHSGQVAFPGGKIEPSDPTPGHAALRETHEEIGIHPDYVELIGALDSYQTGTAYRVLPVLGFVKDGFSFEVEQNEVSDIFEVPLDFILDERNHHIESRKFEGHNRYFYAMHYNNYYIWGATAGMIHNLTDRLNGGVKL